MSNLETAFRKNVPRLLENTGMSQRELARNVNVSAEHLNAALKGRASLSRNLMEKIADALGASLQDLFADERSDGLVTEHAPYFTQNDIKSIPFLEARANQEGAATRPSHVTAPILFKSDWLFAMGSPDRMAMVRTAGSALDGEIPDNSLVLVDMSQTVPVSGAPYFLRLGKEFVIKRLILNDENRTAAEDRDGDRGARELTGDGDWEIIGRCLWYSRSLH